MVTASVVVVVVVGLKLAGSVVVTTPIMVLKLITLALVVVKVCMKKTYIYCMNPSLYITLFILNFQWEGITVSCTVVG